MCGVVWNGVCMCCIHVVLIWHIINLGQYSLPTLNFRTSTKCVCIDLTEVTIASLTLLTVVLFNVSLLTISGLWYPKVLVKWTETLLQHHCWEQSHLHL